MPEAADSAESRPGRELSIVDEQTQRRSLRHHRPRYVENALTGNEVFDLLDDFIIDSDGDTTRQRKRRKKKNNNPKPARPASLGGKTPERPRWYNQMYLMFLALRQSPGYTASRSELVRMAVELDGRISQERGLPRAFTGKTPLNSASALLTNNGDRHFVQFRPPNARCYHFKLAYNPGDFDGALVAYNEWMEVLVTRDWPVCFGPDTESVSELKPVLDPVSGQPSPGQSGVGLGRGGSPGHGGVVADDLDGGAAGDLDGAVADDPDGAVADDPDGGAADDPGGAVADDPDGAAADDPDGAVADDPDGGAADDPDGAAADAPRVTGDPMEVQQAPLGDDGGVEAAAEAPGRSADLNIPKSWRDIVSVRPSTIPNAGNGLFAERDLPAGVPLGFYFGVPMTEDEFDSLKEPVGMSSHYSIMYRKTVLDATDKNGMPYTDPAGPLYCPFHFMNEARGCGNVGTDRCNIAFLEGVKVNQIICLSSRAIKAGEELFVSYGGEVDRSHWDGAAPLEEQPGSVANGGEVLGREYSQQVAEVDVVSPRTCAMRAATLATDALPAKSGGLEVQSQGVTHILQTFTASDS